ncbi:LysR family transcriptional regulator [Bradyrhizobium sp. dw_78]|uniref:LysR family transcriptional regulator n=1 Tax=Bradyrhizobium sp. dw_78 TaxID=2719793 RepID=UPI001BD2A0E0|nr:LysR family transcriptional regulator [Bradyrhizobium sp. dw_78]
MPDAVAELQLFQAIAGAGSLSAAARVLGSSPPAISRRLALLEQRLGVKLADRSARRFRLTDEGTVYLEHGRRILEELRDLETEVASRGGAARGRLRVGAPADLGRRRIAHLLADFATRHRGLEVHLVLSDAGLEVGEDGLDVALRVGLPNDPAVLTRKLLTNRRVICAAPSYLAKHGVPVYPDDLLHHDCLRLARRHSLQDRWRFADGTGTKIVQVAGTLTSSDGEVLRAWALEGRGLSLEAQWDVADDIKEGRLVTCLDGLCAETIELFATYLPSKPVPASIRLFVEECAAAFRAQTA